MKLSRRKYFGFFLLRVQTKKDRKWLQGLYELSIQKIPLFCRYSKLLERVEQKLREKYKLRLTGNRIYSTVDNDRAWLDPGSLNKFWRSDAYHEDVSLRYLESTKWTIVKIDYFINCQNGQKKATKKKRFVRKNLRFSEYLWSSSGKL